MKKNMNNTVSEFDVIAKEIDYYFYKEDGFLSDYEYDVIINEINKAF